jgi:CheY-like chemotaxis protein
MKILVVDDKPDDLDMIESLIDSQYEVVKALDGQEAVEKAKVEKPDLILMDLSMPKVNGWEAAKVIKEDKDIAPIPIIAISGLLADGKERAKAYDAGFVGCLEKPIDPDRLNRLVRTYDHITEEIYRNGND